MSKHGGHRSKAVISASVATGRGRPKPQRMTSGLLALSSTLLVLGLRLGTAEATTVRVHKDDAGSYVTIDGKKTLIRGMNWGYMPVGENYTYDFWGRDDAFIEAALRPEMALLRDMGVNAIRQYAVIPPRWVEWIYEEYGIYTMINPLFGRYGITVDGAWIGNVDYGNKQVREAIIADTMAAVNTYKDTEGVLLWLLGNENNYGLHWTSFEIEELPVGLEDDPKLQNAAALYSLWGEAIAAIKEVDKNHPVSICNGDIQYLELIEEYASNLDILGTNVYRGVSARDLFERVDESLGVPVLFAEFGADAFDAVRGREDHLTQAKYLTAQWEEIYAQSHGRGGVGNAIGGFVFQWSDGWWKHKQTENLEIQDTTASWANKGYPEDFAEGANNMNEEWFGIAAKGQTDANGHYQVFPRAGYYALRDAWRLDPYAEDVTNDAIRAHFAAIDPPSYDSVYKATLAEDRLSKLERFRLERIRAELWTFAGTDAAARGEGRERTRFNHMESVYLGATAVPQTNVRAEVDVNIVGNVPSALMDDIFYEKRGRAQTLMDEEGEPVTVNGIDRVRLYRAKLQWEDPHFSLHGFYREGHFHWGNEGDFFGLYRQAYYGPNIDIYDAAVPLGVEWSGKGALSGLKVVGGPQIYWGANPTIIAKYSHSLGSGVTATLMHQEDIASQAEVSTSRAIPEPLDRRSSLHVTHEGGSLTTEAGVLWSGSRKVGRRFFAQREAAEGQGYAGSNQHYLTDEIVAADTLGAKAKMTYIGSPVSAYAQGMYKGLVADGGPNETKNFSGWSLREDGRGNQVSAMGGLAVGFGSVQIAPHALYQKPLIGPIAGTDGRVTTDGLSYYRPIASRNVLSDPFAVLGNRETLGLELLLSYDPTPGTWMWEWDNVQREDAPFAGNLNFVYRMQPTSRDANFGFDEAGNIFAFGSAPPAQDLWEVRGSIIMTSGAQTRLIGGVYTGTAQSTGSSERTILRKGAEAELWTGRWVVMGALKLDDWGPYDYHRDFNITFPLQVNSEVGYGLRPHRLGKHRTEIRVIGKYRSLDEHSGGDSRLQGQDYELELATKLVVAM